MIGGVILIALGLVFLLNNLGILPWDIWNVLWRLWPLLLIAIGLDFLLGRDSRYRVSLLVGTLVIGGLLVTFWSARPGGLGGAARVEEISENIGDARAARVEISSGVTRLRLNAMSDTSRLIEGRVSLLAGEELERSAGREGDTLVYVLRSRSRGGSFNASNSQGWNLSLSPVIPIDLRVNTGVGESNLDLSGLQLTRLEVNSGVGRAEIRLPGQGQFEARIDGGVGEIRVTLPSSLGVRLMAKAGLGRVDVPRGMVTVGENTYESEGYAAAQNRVNLEINGGIGQIVIQRD